MIHNKYESCYRGNWEIGLMTRWNEKL